METSSGLLVMLAGAFIFGLLISYVIIKKAVDDSYLSKHGEAQTKLLALIAKKSGASDNEINECYKP